MNTLRHTIVAGVILLGSITAYAQPEGGPANRKKQIEARKVAFITTELNLSPEEAQVFWPVYNQAQAERKALREKHKAMRDIKVKEGEPKKTLDTMTDKELEEKMEYMMVHEQAELDLKKKYLKKYKEVLSIRKVAKLYQAEMKFKKRLMSDIRGSGDQRKQMPKRKRTGSRF
jgi:DNA invertase Pin-like site-specific DNA recombinase